MTEDRRPKTGGETSLAAIQRAGAGAGTADRGPGTGDR